MSAEASGNWAPFSCLKSRRNLLKECYVAHGIARCLETGLKISETRPSPCPKLTEEETMWRLHCAKQWCPGGSVARAWRYPTSSMVFLPASKLCNSCYPPQWMPRTPWPQNRLRAALSWNQHKFHIRKVICKAGTRMYKNKVVGRYCDFFFFYLRGVEPR